MLGVEETIQVRVEGNKIKRGIYRDLPTGRRTAFGFIRGTEFKVTSVKRNGEPERFRLSDISGDFLGDTGKRIKIGKKEVLLPHGIHTFTIEYTTTNQLDFLDGKDALFWNVTGNGWAFPIKSAESEIYLPKTVDLREVELGGYTGAAGSEEQAITTEIKQDSVRISSARPLAAEEGLSVFVKWPAGHVYRADTSERFWTFFYYNKSSVFALIGLFLVLSYYYFIWSAVGKDPDKGTIIPLFEAPDGLSPAAVRYLDRMGFDRKAFTAEILQMAVVGYLEIDNIDGVYTLRKTGQSDGSLSPTQRKISEKLFGYTNAITLKQTNYKKFQSAISALHSELKKIHLKRHFEVNRSYFFWGIAFSLAVLFVSAYLHSAEAIGIVAFMSVWLTGWSFGVIMLLSQTISIWKRVVAGEGIMIIGAIFLSIFTFPFLMGECVGIFMLVSATTPVIALVVALLGGLGYLFYHLLKAPTLRGRRIMDKIDGLKLYLGVAEKERLSAAYSRLKDPEEFEKFLPYALALDVEQEWTEKFSSVLDSASSGTDTFRGKGYHPGFYRGTSFNNISSFSSSFNSSFSSALSSASSSPRSSGGGSGGSSGGGGGGGGGGGW